MIFKFIVCCVIEVHELYWFLIVFSCMTFIVRKKILSYVCQLNMFIIINYDIKKVINNLYILKLSKLHKTFFIFKSKTVLYKNYNHLFYNLIILFLGFGINIYINIILLHNACARPRALCALFFSGLAYFSILSDMLKHAKPINTCYVVQSDSTLMHFNNQFS